MKALALICVAAAALVAGIVISSFAHTEVPFYFSGVLFVIFLFLAFYFDWRERRGAR